MFVCLYLACDAIFPTSELLEAHVEECHNTINYSPHGFQHSATLSYANYGPGQSTVVRPSDMTPADNPGAIDGSIPAAQIMAVGHTTVPIQPVPQESDQAPVPTCTRCDKTFSRAADLDRHVKKHDPSLWNNHCSVAGCEYRGHYRWDKVLQHMKNKHPGVQV